MLLREESDYSDLSFLHVHEVCRQLCLLMVVSEFLYLESSIDWEIHTL